MEDDNQFFLFTETATTRKRLFSLLPVEVDANAVQYTNQTTSTQKTPPEPTTNQTPIEQNSNQLFRESVFG